MAYVGIKWQMIEQMIAYDVHENEMVFAHLVYIDPYSWYIAGRIFYSTQRNAGTKLLKFPREERTCLCLK